MGWVAVSPPTKIPIEYVFGRVRRHIHPSTGLSNSFNRELTNFYIHGLFGVGNQSYYPGSSCVGTLYTLIFIYFNIRKFSYIKSVVIMGLRKFIQLGLELAL